MFKSLSFNKFTFKKVATLKKEGKKIVFTNGCFDILHLGHIKILEYAKSQGDILIVGVNSDTSVRELKGKSRPVIHEEDRMKLLEALLVLILSRFLSLRLLKQLKPLCLMF